MHAGERWQTQHPYHNRPSVLPLRIKVHVAAATRRGSGPSTFTRGCGVRDAGAMVNNRVTDKSLNLKRIPNAYAFFLKDMSNNCRKMGRRMHTKTLVWRMDLMRLRYRSLSDDERQVYKDKNAKALQDKAVVKASLVASAVAGEVAPPVPAAATPYARVVVESGGSQMWLSLPMPVASPGVVTSCEAAEPAPPTCAWPCTWQWTEQPSAVQHSLATRGNGAAAVGAGVYGCCLAVSDKLTGESFCIKVPRETGDVASVKLEYQTLSKLQHPNVVRALAWVSAQHDARQGFLMPLATGNLWQWVDRTSGDWVNHTRGDRASALVQIARGLSYVHHAGIVHLDMKPENVIVFEPPAVAGSTKPDGACLFQIADLGVCARGPKGDNTMGSSVASDMVNAVVYRPLHLWYAAGSMVYAKYNFDLWAFGGIVFDVMQRHPRLRSQGGNALRLLSGVPMKQPYMDVLRVRNYRLTKQLEEDQVAVVVRLQPYQSARGGDRLMSAELVRVVMALHR